jgi:hypothetical protein
MHIFRHAETRTAITPLQRISSRPRYVLALFYRSHAERNRRPADGVMLIPIVTVIPRARVTRLPLTGDQPSDAADVTQARTLGITSL